MQKSIERTRKLMQEAAKKLEFIEAAQYRDELLKLEDLNEGKMGIIFSIELNFRNTNLNQCYKT